MVGHGTSLGIGWIRLDADRGAATPARRSTRTHLLRPTGGALRNMTIGWIPLWRHHPSRGRFFPERQAHLLKRRFAYFRGVPLPRAQLVRRFPVSVLVRPGDSPVPAQEKRGARSRQLDYTRVPASVSVPAAQEQPNQTANPSELRKHGNGYSQRIAQSHITAIFQFVQSLADRKIKSRPGAQGSDKGGGSDTAMITKSTRGQLAFRISRIKSL